MGRGRRQRSQQRHPAAGPLAVQNKPLSRRRTANHRAWHSTIGRPWFGSGGLATEGTERSWQIHSVPGSHLRSLLQKTGKPTAVEPRNEQPRIVSVAGLPDCAVTTHTHTAHTQTWTRTRTGNPGLLPRVLGSSMTGCNDAHQSKASNIRPPLRQIEMGTGVCIRLLVEISPFSCLVV